MLACRLQFVHSVGCLLLRPLPLPSIYIYVAMAGQQQAQEIEVL
jgi:hypothetical protein